MTPPLPKPRSSPRRLGVVLLVSFALTVSSFIMTTLILRKRSRGIGSAAESIAANAAPSIARLSNLRTAIGHLEVLLDDETDRVAYREGRRDDRAGIDALRKTIREEWAAYLALPDYPGEVERHGDVVEALAAVERTIDRISMLLGAEEGRAAELLLHQEAKPAIVRLDEALARLVEVNAENAELLGSNIMAIRGSVDLLSDILYLACAIFATIAAVTALLMVRRYAQLMEERVSDLEQFSARVAHDIRSPLTTVGIALNLAERSPQLEPKVRRIIERGGRTLERVGQIVDGLLMFARAGAIPPEDVHAQVEEVLAGVAEEMTPTAESKAIQLYLERETAGAVACAPGVLTSLLVNLVANAIKYMGDAATRRVVLRTRDARAKIRIEVEDTGPGIPIGVRQRIFDIYVRGAGPAIPGLGLGLATVRRLTEAHGGAVGVECHDGGGSVFWLELPKRGRVSRQAS
jgi:signal transduction histidine kinase